MCDQTEVSYLENDVVWVKIGPIWWPGVVKDLEKDEEGREILAGLKKKPIAAVKFFQEENYEFVKNLDGIYHYNCSRKDEFIKKGLDKFRTGAPHMKKFPVDVTTAESLTNGDTNIIHNPKFVPEKKESYSEIFGSGKKKTKKDGEGTPRSRVGRPPSNVTPYRPITHQRFINKVLRGESDHKVKTLIQTHAPNEDSSSKNPYKCHICKFETSRVNVIVAHHRLSHSLKNSINWTGSDSQFIKKKPAYRSRKLKTKKLLDVSKESLIDDDDDDDDDEDDDYNDSSDKQKSLKYKSLKDKFKSSTKIDKVKADKNSSYLSKRKNKKDIFLPSKDLKKPRYTDVLLADWNEDDEDDNKSNDDNSKAAECSDSKTDSLINDGENRSENDVAEGLSLKFSPGKPSEKISCFDFDEEEEGLIGMSNANTFGRKIPRVIPIKDKSELGMDLEMDDLLQSKNVPENEKGNLSRGDENDVESDVALSTDFENSIVDEGKDGKTTKQPVEFITKRRRSRANKEAESKVDSENSLALRRTRRPGAKKSYLNEVIEKIQDGETSAETKGSEKKTSHSEGVKIDNIKSEMGSSSRRKQDFKNQTIDSDREEVVYSDIVKNEKKSAPGDGSEKKRGKHQNSRREIKDNIAAQIDSLLEETKPCNLPEGVDSDGKGEKSEDIISNSNNFSFDYMPAETVGKKIGKSRGEVKSISRMFGESLAGQDGASEADLSNADAENAETSSTDCGLSKPASVSGVKISQGSHIALKRGSIVLSTIPKSSESPVKLVPVVRQVNTSKENIVLPSGKKADDKGENQSSEGETSQRIKNIKAIKVKPESLQASLLSAGKLKGQTIIQKSGKYVIVTQAPQIARQRVASGKVPSGSKVVILTNQHGEQKFITTGGLQQSRFKVEGGKAVATPDGASHKGGVSQSISQAPNQSVIKMVPDGKGGIMKQLTVSPKKVLLGNAKMLVSASGSTFSAGNNVQKIGLSGAGGSSRGGDFRLIENYKGSGKTVLIQGSSNSGGGGGALLKPTSVVPRTVTKVVQSPQAISALKKKPKILMRASAGQEEYVMHSPSGSDESTTFVVKQKGGDGKFAAQKIVCSEVLNQGKATVPATASKTIFVSGQAASKKGESFIITTKEAVPSKVIRMRQKVKDGDAVAASKVQPQKIMTKSQEVYAVASNSVLLPAQGSAETEATQIVQVQEQSQQQQPVLQTQVIAMPGPVGADGNQTYVLVSVDENGVVQGVDNSVVAYDASAQQDQLYFNSTSTGNVMLLNSQSSENVTPVFSTSSQDILAEALANTNVLEGALNNEMEPVVPSILLPPAIPSSVVQETSITLQKPIMTPLEMPSSVTPDTSGLEPPPLPPTPTVEDVLMEETEMTPAENATQNTFHGQKGKQMCSAGETKVFLQPQIGQETNGGAREHAFSISHEPTDPNRFEEQKNEENENEEKNRGNEEEFLLGNAREGEQEPISYQSMPLLSDEPDTSDGGAQGSDPVADQQIDVQKFRSDAVQSFQLVRDQEPPSSTINETNAGTKSSRLEATGDRGPDQKKREEEKEGSTGKEEKVVAGVEEQQKDASSQAKETHSMPVIADENSGFEMDAAAAAATAAYSGIIMQKRFQEETEVSSTTDEFANKNVSH